MLSAEEIISNFKLNLMNDYFIGYLFPEVSLLKQEPKNEFDNPIIHKKVILFSDQGGGKTTLARSLADKAANIYGITNFNGVVSSSIEKLLLYGLNQQLIQFHYLEDYTLSEEDTMIMKAYFKIRNLWKKESNVNNGFIFSLYGIHRFHSSMTEIRSSANAIIVRSDSINPYDHSVIKEFIGEDGIHDLKIIEEYRDYITELKEYSIFRSRGGDVGLIKFPLVPTNYLKDVNTLKPNISRIELGMKRYRILKGD
jgi:hypothetical protein